MPFVELARLLVLFSFNLIVNQRISVLLLLSRGTILQLLPHGKARHRLDQVADEVGEYFRPLNLPELIVGEPDHCPARIGLNQ